MKLSTKLVLAAAAIAGVSANPLTKRAPKPLSFDLVGDAGISAQMMFVGNSQKLYILDKAENNPVTVTAADGTTHPAWGVEYDIESNTYRTMEVQSNTFCAGGAVLGNGTWIVFGGNQPITTNGVATNGGNNAYNDYDGGTAIRLLDPCTDQKCNWIEGTVTFEVAATTGESQGWLQMTGRRWYPMVEALEDGSVIIIGGDNNGGYVNTAAQDNPTYEFWPPKGDGKAINLQFLSDTLPVNLYALTWLLPDGRLFMQASRKTIIYDWRSHATQYLPDMPYATRVYPASAATAMLPLTAANNYTVSLLFCGGSNPPQWGDDGGAKYNVTAIPADNSCVRISPMDASPQYETDDYMLEGRSMGQFVYLPDGQMWMGNGVAMGTAGYGDDYYSVGQSYGQNPLYTPALYNPLGAKGTRWSRQGLSASQHERMYHSTAVLIADGSIVISGSNPNKDFTTQQWGTKTSVERWYPSWYNEARPSLSQVPASLSYGGDAWTHVWANTDENVAKSTKVVVLRGGFNTHAIAFGQRYLELTTSYEIDMNTGNTTLHIAQMPPNPALFQPGPAMLFLVVDGVPSVAEFIMVGSGQLGTQPVATAASLPESNVKAVETPSASASGNGAAASGGSSAANSPSGAAGARYVLPGFSALAAAVLAAIAVC